MKALGFAARSLVRQPIRSGLGILGIAAVGAMLFDMLLLSHGLVVSFRDLLDRVGFDVRVMYADDTPLAGPRVPKAAELAARLRALPEIADAVPLRILEGEIAGTTGRPIRFQLSALDPTRRRPWTIAAGTDLPDTAPVRRGPASAGPESSGPAPLILSQALAAVVKKQPGDTVMMGPLCESTGAAQPAAPFLVTGLADFPFDDEGQLSAATLRAEVMTACGDTAADEADMVLIASRDGHGADAAVAAIRRIRPDLRPATNEQIVNRMQESGFTYFRQISTVLSSIMLLFGFLLITVLLTVSVNQRLAEIAAVRALGFSRARVAADVLSQSAILVGLGGTLAVPLGLALSLWLDRILKAMPGIPLSLHFFVFEPRALLLHGGLLVVTALLAAAYPIWLVASLPIAATLRNEVVS